MGEVINNFIQSMGIVNMDWRQIVMILIACVLLYLAIAKGFEPLLLVPIAFGMLLTNLPLAGAMNTPISSINDVSLTQESINGSIATKTPGGYFTIYTKDVNWVYSHR